MTLDDSCIPVKSKEKVIQEIRNNIQQLKLKEVESVSHEHTMIIRCVGDVMDENFKIVNDNFVKVKENNESILNRIYRLERIVAILHEKISPNEPPLWEGVNK